MNDSPLEFPNPKQGEAVPPCFENEQKDSEIEEKLPLEYFQDEEKELLAKARLKVIRSMIIFLETKSKSSEDYTHVKICIDMYNAFIDMYNAFITNPKLNNK